MNDIQVFNNPNFGSVRTILIDDEVWFVGKDVAERLGYTNPAKALADHVDDEDKLNNESLSSLGQRGGWLINASGLYSLVLSSKLPSAKAFKRWITKEVIPSIQKTGSYSMIDIASLPPEMQQFKIIWEQQAKQYIAQQKLEAEQKEQEKRISALETIQDAIREAVRPSTPETWRKEMLKKFMRIQCSSHIDHQTLWTEIYTELDRRAGTNLKARLKNMRERMRIDGLSKSKINATNNLDVISQDKKLREILEKILTEYELKYCA